MWCVWYDFGMVFVLVFCICWVRGFAWVGAQNVVWEVRECVNGLVNKPKNHIVVKWYEQSL